MSIDYSFYDILLCFGINFIILHLALRVAWVNVSNALTQFNAIYAIDISCFISKASTELSSLWHRRMEHNFLAINKLVLGRKVTRPKGHAGSKTPAFGAFLRLSGLLKNKLHPTIKGPGPLLSLNSRNPAIEYYIYRSL